MQLKKLIFRKTRKQGKLLSESGFVHIAPPPLSRDRRIKMKKSIKSCSQGKYRPEPGFTRQLALVRIFFGQKSFFTIYILKSTTAPHRLLGYTQSF